MKAPTSLTPPTNAPPKKVARDLPAGTGPLVAEARRAFAAGRYEEAEQKYLQVLKQDPNSTFALGNLAAIQMEQNHLEPADSNLSKALEIEPDDAFNVALMGILKFRQNNFDDAYAILSRAVQLDPQNPEALNYLGITLSQKGQREAAEASLRKAIQISPNYAGAHHNLAVIYATQKPAFLELARYHYQKALDNGQERNPELEKLLTK
jgi:Flp pilus assembly protein TadD